MLKTFSRCCIAGSIVLLLACSNSQDTSTQLSSNSNEMTDIDFNSPDIYKPMKGIYVSGEGAETFTPCGSEKDYWVYTSSDDMWTSLKEAHQEAATKPYEGIYIEAYAWTGPKLHPAVGGEYAADFDGHIVIEDVTIMRKKSPTDCK